MKIAVLGATGRTGVRFVKEALDLQHNVVAVVRDPAKLKNIQNDRLNVATGDVFSEQSLADHFKDVDAVVSCLGFNRSSPGYTESIKSIVSAMRTANIRRLVVMTAYYTDITSAENGSFFVRWVIVPMLRPKLINRREMEKYLDTNCSDIDFTVVRPPGLSDGSSSGKPVRSQIDVYFLPNSNRMPRVDVAKFMLDCLTKPELSKKCVAIAA